MYLKERKIHWDLSMPSKFEKMDEYRVIWTEGVDRYIDREYIYKFSR
jgi:hypothetical protein